MRFGLTLPIFDRLADPRLLAELAFEAETAGWQAVFLWDHISYRPPVQAVTDPWVALAAMALQTERVLLGPMVTPLARRRPQVVARQLVALDHLSRGRVVLGVGLGLDSSGGEFVNFGEETDPRRRAEILDEGLDVLTSLMSGATVDHRGPHFTVSDVRFLPVPVRGHVPIWVAARWPHRRPLRRAARFDGVFVIDVAPADLPGVIEAIGAERPAEPGDYDVVVDGPPGSDPRPWEDAGATWMLTTFDPFTVDADVVRAAIAGGPPG